MTKTKEVSLTVITWQLKNNHTDSFIKLLPRNKVDTINIEAKMLWNNKAFKIFLWVELCAL